MNKQSKEQLMIDTFCESVKKFGNFCRQGSKIIENNNQAIYKILKLTFDISEKPASQELELLIEETSKIITPLINGIPDLSTNDHNADHIVLTEPADHDQSNTEQVLLSTISETSELPILINQQTDNTIQQKEVKVIRKKRRSKNQPILNSPQVDEFTTLNDTQCAKLETFQTLISKDNGDPAYYLLKQEIFTDPNQRLRYLLKISKELAIKQAVQAKMLIKTYCDLEEFETAAKICLDNIQFGTFKRLLKMLINKSHQTETKQLSVYSFKENKEYLLIYLDHFFYQENMPEAQKAYKELINRHKHIFDSKSKERYEEGFRNSIDIYAPTYNSGHDPFEAIASGANPIPVSRSAYNTINKGYK